jgi:hypothetical protein
MGIFEKLFGSKGEDLGRSEVDISSYLPKIQKFDNMINMETGHVTGIEMVYSKRFKSIELRYG